MQMAAAAAPTDAPAATAAAAPHHHPHAHAAAAAAAAPPHPHAHAAHPHHHHMPQPRWVVIPYPPPHHPMVAAPPPPPPQFVKHFAPPASVTPPPPPSAGSGGNGGEDNRTIWVGDLQYWMDENYLHSCFGPSGEVVTIKVIRNRHSGVSEGYGFVEFYSHASAEKALQNFSGHVIQALLHQGNQILTQLTGRADAEEALQGLNGSTIGKQAVRLSWGRSPASKQSRGVSGHRRNSNGMYYGTPFYGGYGYASPVPHPNMYAAAYGAYPYYGNQQLVS
nr:unnamed protein product [Digitaria exilis]